MQPTRRTFLLASGAALSLAALPRQAAALSISQAERLVSGLVGDVNAVIATNPTEARMIREFEGIFDRYSDVPTIARYCLGVDARRASAAQMRAYTVAFRVYIARKYGRRFREFIGGQVQVVGARPVKNWIEVETTVLLRGRSPIRMDWHVSDRSGRPAFFNFIIEGVNMLLAEREEIGAMLDRRRGNIDALIADMQSV